MFWGVGNLYVVNMGRNFLGLCLTIKIIYVRLAINTYTLRRLISEMGRLLIILRGFNWGLLF